MPKDDAQQAYIKLVDVKKVDGTYKSDDSGKWVTILGMECRGLVPTTWKPSTDFHVKTIGGAMFESVDLSDGDWAEYDEENDASVSITNLESKIESQN